MTWALLHHGFRYMSDELAPIDFESMRVLPYPQAVHLKRPPPAPYAISTGAAPPARTMRVPVSGLPVDAAPEPHPFGVVFLLERRPELSAPTARKLGASEAAARLYVNTLNALAHPNWGLDAVVRIAEHAPCFAVASADLAATCSLIAATVRQSLANNRRSP
jgi:hypothetical protein